MQIAEQSAQRSLNFQMTDESINLSGGARRAVAEVAAEVRCFDSWVGVGGGLLSSWVSTSNGEFSSILIFGTFERYWSRNPVLINRPKFRQIVDRLFTGVLCYKSSDIVWGCLACVHAGSITELSYNACHIREENKRSVYYSFFHVSLHCDVEDKAFLMAVLKYLVGRT